jgi:hypothetical protein
MVDLATGETSFGFVESFEMLFFLVESIGDDWAFLEMAATVFWKISL